MRILIILAQFTLGGTETYSLTVAEQLEYLGHEVLIQANEVSDAGRQLASSRCVRIAAGDPGDLDGFDAVIAQDAAGSYLVGSRRPDLPQISVTHGLERFEQPARLESPPIAVALNDRIARRLGALALCPEVVRLRQPIDTKRFRPRAPIRKRARRVLLLSNYLDQTRQRLLREVCDELGLELVKRGASGTSTTAPQEEIAAADIVVGYGRSVLEGMAMGRAAYVWDYAGGDGWVTPATYRAMEADGFSGTATDEVVDRARLRADLASCRPELAAFNFDLVRQWHSAVRHAEELVGLFGQAGPRAGGSALEELSLLTRAETRAAMRAAGLLLENRRVWEENETLRALVQAGEEEVASERARRLAAEERLGAALGSRSWRLLRPLRWLGARLRGARAS